MFLKTPYRFILLPLSIIYGLFLRLRHLLYDKGILKTTSFPFPVICIGNIALGGTGKTPITEYLVRLLQYQYKVAILSRGYKRKTKGFILANKKPSALDIGDEPFQYSQKFKDIAIAVDANRVRGIQKIHDKEIVILDDAFQYRAIKAGLNIILTSFQNLYINDFLIPVGYLRDIKKRVSKADCIIITKCPKNISSARKKEIIKQIAPLAYQKVFFSYIHYGKIVGNNPNLLNEASLIHLVTGIANPKPLLHFLEEKKIKFKLWKYPNHYYFSEKDIDFLRSKNNLLTTEKDFARLKGRLKQVHYIPIEMRITDPKEFDHYINNFIKDHMSLNKN